MNAFTYPNLQFPQIQNLHRCNRSHCEHSPFLFRHSRRLVLATIKLSGLRHFPTTAFFCLPSWMAMLPSSKKTLVRTESSTVKLWARRAFRLSKSKHPRLSHRVLVINLETTEDILKRQLEKDQAILDMAPMGDTHFQEMKPKVFTEKEKESKRVV